MWNASDTLPRMLHSICGQSYENWKLILIDDVSSDEHKVLAQQTILQFQCLLNGRYHNKIIDVWNEEKKWEVSNVLKGISLCDDDDIVCRIDADDALCDTDALAIIDATYQQTNCDALWTAHRWGLSDRNISGPLPEDSNPYIHPWVSSHMKTFRKRLINNVPYENFVNQNGDLVRRCGDQSIYLPVLHNAAKYFFLPRVMYHYTIDEQGGTVYQTEDAKFQKAEADFIRNRGYIGTGRPWEEHIV